MFFQCRWVQCIKPDCRWVSDCVYFARGIGGIYWKDVFGGHIAKYRHIWKCSGFSQWNRMNCAEYLTTGFLNSPLWCRYPQSSGRGDLYFLCLLCATGWVCIGRMHIGYFLQKTSQSFLWQNSEKCIQSRIFEQTHARLVSIITSVMREYGRGWKRNNCTGTRE
jgi:hypothetical protein